MKEKYIPGEGCECSARCSCECGCDVDWTPREVYELRATISDMEIRHSAAMLHTQSIVNEANELREQRDRLDRKLDEALQETARVRQYMDHGFKVAAEEATELREQRDMLAEALEMVRDADEDCHKDGLTTIPKAARHRIDMALAAVKGGSHE